MATKRKYISGEKAHLGRTKNFIDMEDVYRMRDKGMSVQEIADHYEVSRQTLYRKHKKYQDMIHILQLNNDDEIENYTALEIEEMSKHYL